MKKTLIVLVMATLLLVAFAVPASAHDYDPSPKWSNSAIFGKFVSVHLAKEYGDGGFVGLYLYSIRGNSRDLFNSR